MICHKHKSPLVPIPDRKINCICGRYERLRCPDLHCSTCICDKCALSLNKSAMNEIIPSTDEEISLNDNSNFDKSNCDNSLNSISTVIGRCKS